MVLFWDIDGTLIDAAGAGVQAWLKGMVDCFGLDGNIEGIQWAGRTDPYIGRLFFEKYQIHGGEERFNAFLDRYVAFLPDQLESLPGRILPGVTSLLERVAGEEGVHQGLLTGNIARGAEAKLRHYGLWDYFSFGSYSDGVFDRNDLSPRALDIARERVDPALQGEHLVVIGDTPHDVRCGKVIGAQTVAVATGNYSEAELEAEEPDRVYPDFKDTEQVLRDLGIR